MRLNSKSYQCNERSIGVFLFIDHLLHTINPTGLIIIYYITPFDPDLAFSKLSFAIIFIFLLSIVIKIVCVLIIDKIVFLVSLPISNFDFSSPLNLFKNLVSNYVKSCKFGP